MINELEASGRDLERARINGEIAKIPWRELQRFFAAGKVMWVAADLDLVDVAYAMQQDALETVAAWTGEYRIGPVSDSQARGWIEGDTVLWAVVVKPWVLVQEPK